MHSKPGRPNYILLNKPVQQGIHLSGAGGRDRRKKQQAKHDFLQGHAISLGKTLNALIKTV